MIRRSIVHRRNRRKLQNNLAPAGVQATISGTAVAANAVTFALSTTVQLQGTPLSWKVLGVSPTSATQVDATHIKCQYAAAVATNAWTVTANDPGVTTPSGGFVQGSSGTL
jgi:hypothetical protein